MSTTLQTNELTLRTSIIQKINLIFNDEEYTFEAFILMKGNHILKKFVLYEYYSLHWVDPQKPWILRSGHEEYLFQLPESILKEWLNKSTDELEMKREAINCKANLLSNMVVYYTEHGQPVIKMISIDRFQLEDAIKRLR